MSANLSKVAIVRGKHLNQYEMQIFEPLVDKYAITAFSSLTPFQDNFAFPAVKLPSPMDIPEFPYKMSLLNRAFTDAQYLVGLENKLKGYDIVHTAETYYRYTQQALNAKDKGYVKKVVATILENIPFNNEGILGRKDFKKRAREELDHMIALTNRTKEALLLEGADEKKITVISHGINTEKFIPKKNKNSSKNINILFAGRLEIYKGIYEVLYAFKRLISDQTLHDYNLSLTIVGDGSEKERLMEREKELEIAHLIQHMHVSYSDMPHIYQQADIYVAPSKASRYWIEQYNTSLLEAQAAGLPIVTTYSGGIPENVGDAAILVNPDDVLSLRDALKVFITSSHRRSEYGKKARERALTVHDAKIIANKIAAVYEQLL